MNTISDLLTVKQRQDATMKLFRHALFFGIGVSKLHGRFIAQRIFNETITKTDMKKQLRIFVRN